jgi:hypothetical protein
MVRATAAVVGGLTFAGGVGVVGASPWNYSGHNSHNGGSSTTTKAENNSTVGLNNNNKQVAKSGDATVSDSQDKDGHHYDKWNKDSNDPSASGDKSASTGDAKNSNSLSADVSVDQSGNCGCADNSSSSDKGSNKVNTTITNNSIVGINNNNDQYAASGNATVSGNKSAGSATTGNASNSNSATISVTVKQ